MVIPAVSSNPVRYCARRSDFWSRTGASLWSSRASRRGLLVCLVVLLCGVLPGETAEPATGRILQVGLNRQLKTPSAAAAAAKDGDTIEIDAGEYVGDVAVWSANRLTIRGVNGMAHLEAAGKSAQQKAIWVIRGNDTIVEHIEFTGCKVRDRNGAGIRQEGRNLTLRRCSFHDNEDGILAGANPESVILIEHSEFNHNGFGDGQSHNIYIGKVKRFTLQYCWSHRANVGHLVKSRAEENFILCNRLTDEQDGNSSYVVDLPNGGRSFIAGNVIQHGPKAVNRTAVSYAAEGAANATQELYVAHNTYVNQRAAGGQFLRVVGKSPLVRVVNNLVVGASIVLEGPGRADNNLIMAEPGFVDAKSYDYRLVAQSKANKAGIDPGKVGDFSLLPAFQYRHPLEREPRPLSANPDIGAFGLKGR